MKRRFGGLLSLVLGLVLIVGGGLGTNNATGGDQQPTCEQFNAVGGFNSCPQGTISITEVTKPDGTTADPWTVTITSPTGAHHCSTPNGPDENEQLTVANNGTESSQSLFIYTDPAHATTCEYRIVETTVTGFTTTYDPGQTVTIPFTQQDETHVRDVTITNTKAAPSSSAASSSSSAAPSSSAAEAPVAASSSAAPLADTGPRSQVRVSLLAGIALCLLGLVLLVAGTRPIPLRLRGKRG